MKSKNTFKTIISKKKAAIYIGYRGLPTADKAVSAALQQKKTETRVCLNTLRSCPFF